MSDSSDLNKYKLFETVVIPSWLMAMPEDWLMAYFDVSATCAIATRWGSA